MRALGLALLLAFAALPARAGEWGFEIAWSIDGDVVRRYVFAWPSEKDCRAHAAVVGKNLRMSAPPVCRTLGPPPPGPGQGT